KHTGTEFSLGELYINTGFKNEFSTFAKINYNINSFNLLADIQYRYADFNYEGLVEMDGLSWHFFNPRIGLTYELKDKSHLYYSIGRTGREPTRTDIFLGNDDLITDDLGNPLLGTTQAESVWDNELGYRKTSDKFQLDLNLFYMIFQNEIVLNGQFGPNGLPLNSSVAKSFRSGLELDFIYKTDFGIIAQTVASYNHSRIMENGETFQPLLTPRFIFQENVNYSFKDFSVGLTGRYQSKSYIDFANEYELDNYFTLDFYLGYKYKFAEINFRLNNLTNKRYFNNGQFDVYGTPTYHIQAPINFHTGIKFIF
ncbi:MAG: TonB-dependent receptor domain-containing protein, partial [Saprospiraceae bacterium]